MGLERSTALPARVSRACSVPNADTGWKHRATGATSTSISKTN